MTSRKRKASLQKLRFEYLESRQLLTHPGPGPEPFDRPGDLPNADRAERDKSSDRAGDPHVASFNAYIIAATSIGSHSDTVRASVGKAAGKWYFEIFIEQLGDGVSDAIGIATQTLNLDLIPGMDAVGCGYRSDGRIYCNRGQVQVGFAEYDEGDVVGVAVDLDRGRAFFSRNGHWLNGFVPSNRRAKGLEMGLAGESESGRELEPRTVRDHHAFPAVNISTTDSLTANFGEAPFRFAAPKGFRPGWYSQRNGQRDFATWNPRDKQSNITLSNNNLTAQTGFLPPGSELTAQWNPFDRQENIQLSNNNLTAETVFPDGSHSDNDSVRATLGHATGKWYFEVEVEKRSYSGYNAIGTATKLLPLEITPGADDYGCGYQASGYVQCNLRQVIASYESYDAGDMIGVAVDLDNNLAYFSKNGRWQGGANPETMTGGLEMGLNPEFVEFYPAVNISTDDRYTANFGATSLKYQVPGGFNRGW